MKRPALCSARTAATPHCGPMLPVRTQRTTRSAVRNHRMPRLAARRPSATSFVTSTPCARLASSTAASTVPVVGPSVTSSSAIAHSMAASRPCHQVIGPDDPGKMALGGRAGSPVIVVP